MKKLCLALVALSLTAPAFAADDIAPAVKRKPAPAAASGTTTAASAPQARPASAQDFQAALAAAAAQDGGEAALDTSLVRVMSRLLAAGRCGEAVSLANRDGRKGLAARAQQLCR